MRRGTKTFRVLEAAKGRKRSNHKESWRMPGRSKFQDGGRMSNKSSASERTRRGRTERNSGLLVTAQGSGPLVQAAGSGQADCWIHINLWALPKVIKGG